jgi:hypothetical protein
MPFSESIKRKVKEHAHYKCCLCRKHWVAHVHHITPEAEDGPNIEDNAAPLCANCHDLYGGNPDKRKFIKESRDFWYNLCDKSSPPDLEMIREMHEHLHKEVVTKTDLDNALKPLYSIMNQNLPHSEQLQVISDITAVISTSAISDAIVTPFTTTCPKCNTDYGIDANKCPNCGWSESDLFNH